MSHQGNSTGSPTAEKVTPAPNDAEIVSRLSFGPITDLNFKRYSNGGVMLGQGDDLIYLEPRHFDLLQQFMSLPLPVKQERF